MIAKSLRHAATVAAKRGQLDEAEQWLLDGREIATELGDDETNARILLLLGDIARMRGEPEEALRRSRRALAQFSALGDTRAQADALVSLSVACRLMGDLARTESYARQAIPLFERLGSKFGVASCENAYVPNCPAPKVPSLTVTSHRLVLAARSSIWIRNSPSEA